MSYTITHEKINFEYLNPRVELISIEDIAHSLSHLCRFTGHTNVFYSVAQHSVLVSLLVSRENALWGLLHDAAEAYVNDLSQPLKEIINGRYCEIEKGIMRVVCKKVGLPEDEPEEVKFIDRVLTINELRLLVDKSYFEPGIEDIFMRIEGWSPQKAKNKFLKRYGKL